MKRNGPNGKRNDLFTKRGTEMQEQQYIIKNQDSFELKHIFDCGQCFRWNEEQDQSYTGVIKQGVLNVQKQDSEITFKGMLERRY